MNTILVSGNILLTIITIIAMQFSVSAQVTWINLDVLSGVHYSILPHSGGCVFVGTGTNGLFKSCDDGITWEIVYDDATVSAVVEDNNGNILAGTREHLVKSMDGGATWDTLSVVGSAAIHPYIFIDQHNKYYVSVVNYGLYLSTDEGATWKRIQHGLPDETTTVVGTDKFDNIYAGLFYAGLFKSTDRGMSWNRILEQDELFLDFVYSESAMLFTARYYTYRSISEGNNWEIVNHDGYSLSLDEMCKFDSNVFYGVKEANSFMGNIIPATLSQTTDAGASWSVISDDNEFYIVTDMCISKNGYIYVVTADTMYRTSAPVVTSTKPFLEATSFSLSPAYPNPAAKGKPLQFNYSLAQAGSITLTLSNTLGKEMQRVEEYASPGAHTYTLQTSGLPPGMYFYSLRTGGQLATKTLLIMR